MPIRFRCAYCNQMLGIARRKAGTVVRCPTCAGEVIVPMPDDPSVAAAPEPGEKMLFERNDFDDVFSPTAATPRPAEKPAVAASATGPLPSPPALPPVPEWVQAEEVPTRRAEFDVEPATRDVPAPPPVRITPAQSGILVTSAQVTMLAVAALVALLLAFGAGLLVGLSLRSGAA
jgi:hypothetical protein